MKLSRALIMVMGLGLLLAPAWAVPTLNATSGYVLQPDAGIVSMGDVEVAGAFVKMAGENEVIPMYPCDGRGTNLRAVTGLTQRGEIGIGYQDIDKEYGAAAAFTLAAKYRLYEDPTRGITGAVGASYRNWSSDLSEFVFKEKSPSYRDPSGNLPLPEVTSLYVAVDKTWALPKMKTAGTLTVGLTADHFKENMNEMMLPMRAPYLPFYVGGHTFYTPFVGVRATAGEYQILADYKPQQEADGLKYQDHLFSLAIRRQVHPDWTMTAGLSTGNLPYTTSETALFLDAAYEFGK